MSIDERLLRPFDLDKALTGTPAYTRQGNRVVGLQLSGDNHVTGFYGIMLGSWQANGKSMWKFGESWDHDDKTEDYDLFLGTECTEHTGWVAVYTDEQQMPQGLGHLRKVTGRPSPKIYATEEICRDMHPDADAYRKLCWVTYAEWDDN